MWQTQECKSKKGEKKLALNTC